MQTFNLNCAFDLRAVVPEQFLRKMRLEALSDEATPFLKRLQEQYPTDDDAFMLALLRHALRRIVAGSIWNEFAAVGVGGTFSPATVKDRTPPEGVEPALASEINRDQRTLDLRHAVPA